MTVLNQDLTAEIDYTGVHPPVVRKAVTQALGVQTPISWFIHTETTFDSDRVFRHVTVVLLTKNRFIHVHVDDGNAHAIASYEVVCLHNIQTHAVSSVYGISASDTAENDSPIVEMTLSLNWSTVSRVEVEPATCGDSSCAAEHGFTGTIAPDDFSMRVSIEVEGEAAIKRFERFIQSVSAELARLDDGRQTNHD